MKVLKSRRLKRIMTRIVAMLMCIILAFNSDFVGVVFAEDTTETTEEKEYTKDENGFTCWEDPEMRDYVYLIYKSTNWGLDMNLNFVVDGGISLAKINGGIDNLGDSAAEYWDSFDSAIANDITIAINDLDEKGVKLGTKYSPKHYEKFIHLFIFNAIYCPPSGFLDLGFIGYDDKTQKYYIGESALEKNGTTRGIYTNEVYKLETIYDVFIQCIINPEFSVGGMDCEMMVRQILRKIGELETYIVTDEIGENSYAEFIDIYDTSGASLYALFVSLYYPSFYDYLKQNIPISNWWYIEDSEDMTYIIDDYWETVVLPDIASEKSNIPFICFRGSIGDSDPFFNNLAWFKSQYSAIKIDTEGATVQGY